MPVPFDDACPPRSPREDLCPPRACQVCLVRHGTTALNVQRRYRGRRDVPLDGQGWRDAATAARELAGVGLVAVYASPLDRARDTAGVIAETAGLDRVIDLPGLVNLDYGEWEGRTAEEAARSHPEAFERYNTYSEDAACPGGERLADAADRIVEALRTLGRRHPGQAVAAVSHAVMVRLAIAAITDSPRSQWRRQLPTGSVSVFAVDGDRLSLLRTPAMV